MVDVTNTFTQLIDKETYPFLRKYTHPVKTPSRPIIGRDRQMHEILATFASPELSNVLLLAEGGGGKTALVQGLMEKDHKRIYLEVQLSKMIADAENPDDIAEWLRQTANEASSYRKTHTQEVVLFIDEFHQIAKLSQAAVEVLKPILADSGTRGIRFIAATTNREFRDHLIANQPLVERLKRIALPQPNEDVTIKILRDFADRYHVGNLFPDDSIFHMIYSYTNRYVPSQIQPRKSIRVLDSMIGYYREDGSPMNKELIGRVLYDQEGVSIAFKADADRIEQHLNKHVIQQQLASSAIAHRLQICIADLNDKSKPMASMLFTGSTGVGKTETAKQMAKLLLGDTQNLIRFDMTEYAEESSVERFRTELTAQIWAHPTCILLLDEIEKSCAPVTRILLQVLDDGRMQDANNRTVSFINSYIVMTSNAANEIYKTIGQYQPDKDNPRRFLQQYEGVIRQSISEATDDNKFPPELLGRIDTIVPFRPLDEDTLKTITKMHLKMLYDNLRNKHGVICEFDPKIIEYLVENEIDLTDSNSGGARSLVHKLETDITTPIAQFINKYPNVKHITAKVEGTMASEDEHILQNTSVVKVYQVG